MSCWLIDFVYTVEVADVIDIAIIGYYQYKSSDVE